MDDGPGRNATSRRKRSGSPVAARRRERLRDSMRIRAGLSRSCALAALAVALPGAAAAQSGPPAGAWRARDTPPGWSVARSPDYEVQSEVGQACAERLAAFLQALRPRMEALWPPRPRAEPLVVKVFATRSGRAAWLADRDLLLEPPAAGRPPTCALLEPLTRDVLAFDTGRLFDELSGPAPVAVNADRAVSLPRADLQRLYPLLEQVTAAYTPDLGRDVAHEAWHQYLAVSSLDRAELPAWLDEGLADWLAAATPGGAPWRLRAPPPAPDGQSAADPAPVVPGALHESRLRELLQAHADRLTLPAGALIVRQTTDADAEPASFLAQGWSLVHVLMTSPTPALRELLPSLLAVRRGDRASDPLHDLDLRRLEADWSAWLKQQTAVDPLLDVAREFRRGLVPEDLQAADDVRASWAWHLRHPGRPAR